MKLKHNSKLSVYQMTAVSLMTALLCILGPIAIPVGAVPISFTNFVIYLAIYLLGTKLGTLSCCIYLLAGMAGLPVFSGYSGGLTKLAGPTGGYLMGFLFLAIISGIFIHKYSGKTGWAIFGMGIGTLTAYLFGTIWFQFQTNCTLWYALTICVFPFLIFDAIKIVLAAKMGMLLRHTLQKAHLLENL